MFLMPTTLRVRGEIIIQGEMESNGRLNIALRNDSYNICQLDVFYPTDSQYENRIDILPSREDSQSFSATDYFDEMNYSVRFRAFPNALSIYVGQSHLETVPIQFNIEDIKYISVNGYVKEEPRQGEDHYSSTQLNGGSRAPPWQTPDQNMYRMPTELNINNEIIIRGVMPSDRLLNVELRNDSEIIAQMKVNENNIVELSPRGSLDLIASDIFVEASYSLKFRFNNALSISVNDSHVDTIPLNHAVQDIKYLTINGEVKELRFLFE